MKFGLRIITEYPARFFNICKGSVNIARLHRKFFPLCFFSDRFFNCPDQPIQRNCLGFPDVDYLKTGNPVDTVDQSLQDVIDKGIIAACCSISIKRNRFIPVYEPEEFMDR